jgi:cell wall-associated NlpC family hydrolase
MSVEGFVRASGALMGIARDAFGAGVGSVGSPPISPVPDAPAGTGAAHSAFDNGSQAIGAQLAALDDRDAGSVDRIGEAARAAAAGRDRIDALIDAAYGDVAALAPSTDTPQGRRALVDALSRRLRETKAVLDHGAADAATHAASASVSAAAYNVAGRFLAAPVPVPIPAVPLGVLTAAAAPLSSLANIVCWLPQRQPAQAGDQQATTGNFKLSWPSGDAGDRRVDEVVNRALSQRGVRYSWGGGSPTGPSRGQDGDIGFDCSSLVRFAYTGAGVDLPRSTYDQVNLGQRVPRYAIRAGDLIFSNFDSRGPGHVQLAISPTQTVEAPTEGGHVQISAVPVGRVVVKRILS